jgi:hypothetical protein
MLEGGILTGVMCRILRVGTHCRRCFRRGLPLSQADRRLSPSYRRQTVRVRHESCADTQVGLPSLDNDAHEIPRMKFGYLIPIAVLFVISFPPVSNLKNFTKVSTLTLTDD